jgi:hypothetical protein
LSGHINLFEEVKNKGMRLLVIGQDAANGDYKFGKGHVFTRTPEQMPQLNAPTDINIVVFQEEPAEAVRRLAMDTTRGVEGSQIHDAWKEDV